MNYTTSQNRVRELYVDIDNLLTSIFGLLKSEYKLFDSTVTDTIVENLQHTIQPTISSLIDRISDQIEYASRFNKSTEEVQLLYTLTILKDIQRKFNLLLQLLIVFKV